MITSDDAIKNFATLIDLDLQGLLNFSTPDLFLGKYQSILIHYLKNDLDTLNQIRSDILLNPLSDPAQQQFLKTILDLRMHVRTRSFSAQDVDLASQPHWQSSPFAGEVLFVLGMGLEQIKRYMDAVEVYQKAFEALTQIGAHKKSIAALHNKISNQSKIYPQKSFFVDFFALYRLARRHKDSIIAGMALNNISAELEKMGALKTALRYSCKAVSLTKPEFSTVHHQMCLLNRCYILVKLQRYAEAKEDYLILKSSTHGDIKSNLDKLDLIFSQEGAAIDFKTQQQDSAAHPLWLERLVRESALPLTEFEERFMDFITRG
ncbi:MAG: hypothetical protein ACOYOK_15980, partial [Pseudobdellovibrionaceae bacterium]